MVCTAGVRHHVGVVACLGHAGRGVGASAFVDFVAQFRLALGARRGGRAVPGFVAAGLAAHSQPARGHGFRRLSACAQGADAGRGRAGSGRSLALSQYRFAVHRARRSLRRVFDLHHPLGDAVSGAAAADVGGAGLVGGGVDAGGVFGGRGAVGAGFGPAASTQIALFARRGDDAGGLWPAGGLAAGALELVVAGVAGEFGGLRRHGGGFRLGQGISAAAARGYRIGRAQHRSDGGRAGAVAFAGLGARSVLDGAAGGRRAAV